MVYLQLIFILYYRIHGINSSEGAFQSFVFHLSIETAVMKTQHFINNWKALLTPFAALKQRPCCPFIIIIKVPVFKRIKVCFEIYVCFIFSLSFWASKPFRAIKLLLDSNFIQPLGSVGKFIYFIEKGLVLIFSVDLLLYFHGLVQLLQRIECIYHLHFSDI